MNNRAFVTKTLPWVGFVAAVLGPVCLLWNLDARFYYDWQNHEWYIGYFGEYFRQHWTMPQVINAQQIVGLPQPIFYGYLFYPTLGFVSTFTGAALALRISIVAAIVVQFWAVYTCAARMLQRRLLAYVTAACVTWEIYPLTNLYNRGALTEYFAVIFLTSAVALGVTAVVRPQDPRRTTFLWLGGILGTLAFGCHPPTALVGTVFVGLLLLAAMWFQAAERRIAGSFWGMALVVSILGVLVLSPWIWANLRFHDDLYILAKLRRFVFFPDRTESFLGRFSPVPYDALAVRLKGQVSTPYAEAQISVPLLVLVFWQGVVIYRSRRMFSKGEGWRRIRPALALGVVALAWFAFTTVISLSPQFAGLFSAFAAYIQFPARFVSHTNMALLVILATSGVVAMELGAYERYARSTRIIAAAVLALALVSLVIKLRHAAFVEEVVREERYAWRGHRASLVTSGRLDSATDYATVKSLPQLTLAAARQAMHVDLPVGSEGREFARTSDASIDLAKPQWVVTNVVAFRWGQLLVNGKPVSAAETAANGPFVAVRLPAGRQTFRWVWLPERTWEALRWIAFGSAALLVAGLCWSLLAGRSDDPTHRARVDVEPLGARR